MIGWIIVGAMGGVLALAAIVVAVLWYAKRKRATYEVINGTSDVRAAGSNMW